MKKKFLLYTILVCFLNVILIIHSCQKFDTEIQVVDDEPLFAKAKAWRLQQISSPRQKAITSIKAVKHLEPLWDEAYTQKESDGSISVVVPAELPTVKLTNLGIRRAFLFRTSNGQIQDGIILEAYGPEGDLKKNNRHIFGNFENSLIRGFNGYIIAYNINYKYLTGASFKNGKRQTGRVQVQAKKLSSISTKSNAIIKERLAPTNTVMNEGVVCMDRYLVLTWPNGYQEWIFLGTLWCTDGGGGTSTPGGSAPPVDASNPGDDYELMVLGDTINLRNKILCFDAVENVGASYIVKLRADLPVNSIPNAMVDPYFNPGHAFLSLSKSNNGTTVTQNIGFYPQNGLKSTLNTRVASQILNDQNHEYDAEISMTVTKAQFDAMIAEALLKSNEKYDLGDYNCSDFAIDVFNKGMTSNNQLNVPDWVSVNGLFNYGTTPNGLYQTLVNMQGAGNSNVNIQTSNSSASTNCN